MKFSTRNAFYLRASNYRVIPLFLYLDERHVDWMEDRVLQLVIAELQPKMRELLSNARWEKKHKVYAERGEGYQYCYFLRSTTRTEVVLLKEKTHTLRAPTPPPPAPAVETSSTPTKRKRVSRSRTRSVSAAVRDDSPPLVNVDDEPEIKSEPSSPAPAAAAGLDEDEDEDREVQIKDMKPSVDVSYKGFGTSSLQLVLIIEPYPPLAPEEYAPPSSRLSTRSASIPASYSRSRSKLYSGSRAGMEPDAARTSTSQSVGLGPRGGSRTAGVQASAPTPTPTPNMRNASRSVSTTPAPNSRRGGASASATPYGASSTPFGSDPRSGRAAPGTPLFIPRDTPFGDEEDEEAHEAYTEALREGRLRLPSVSRPAGTPMPGDGDDDERSVRRRSRYDARDDDDDDDENVDDIPDGMMRIGERLVRSSQIEQGVNRVQAGWEERVDGEESAVMGREEPDE